MLLMGRPMLVAPRVAVGVFLTRLPVSPTVAGLSASGKSTVATALEAMLHQRGHLTMLLDGDNVRHGLNSNLGFRCGLGGSPAWRTQEVWPGDWMF